MDNLDRVLVPGRDLLSQVDEALCSYGAPQDHPVVRLTLRLGMLPGEALECIAALDAEPMGDVAITLRAVADRYAGHRLAVDAAVSAMGWRGRAAESFAATWGSLGGYLGEGEHADEASMAGRVLGLMGYLDGVAAWVLSARTDLAVAIAEVLGSAEAVSIRSSVAPSTPHETRQRVSAAAGIGAKVLSTVDMAVAAGHDVREQWAPRLAELRYTGQYAGHGAGQGAGQGAGHGGEYGTGQDGEPPTWTGTLAAPLS